jgi:hypothetical protein
MNIYAMLLGIFLCTGMVSILALIICNSMEKINKRNKIPPESELLDVLNRAIEREFRYKVDFTFKIKGVKIVGDIEGEVNDLVKKTLESLSGNLLDDLQYYYSIEAITSMVFKAHLILLTAYMDKNNKKEDDSNIKRITK